MIVDLQYSSPFIKSLLTYKNVEIQIHTVDEFIKGTFLQPFFDSGELYKTEFFTNNLSNVLRLLALWKTGGIYLDLDVIVTKPLDEMPSNFACAESKYSVNNAVLKLDQNLGRNLSYLVLK